MTTTIRASATDKRITHHISLTDNGGNITIGLRLVDPKSIIESPLQQTSLKMSQGDTDYSDFNLPFTPITQKDWSGGRAQENFEDDKTRYSDSYMIDTTHGDVRLAPATTLTTGTDASEENGMTTALMHTFSTKNPSVYGASSFVAAASATYGSIDLLIRNRAIGAVAVTVSIYTDSGDAPNTIIAGTTSSSYVPAFTDVISPVRFPMTLTTTAGTKYWIVVSPVDGFGGYTYLDFGYYASAGNRLLVKPSSTWVLEQADRRLSYKFSTSGVGATKFFEYKGAMYAVVNNSAGTAPRLFINGYRGTCTAASTLLNFVTGSFGSVDLGGKIVKIVAGKGYDQFSNWREISTGAGSGGNYGVATNWNVAPDATTEIVVLGCDTWTEIANHGLVTSVTDICVANGIVYFAQGEAKTIRRMREYNNAGTWTREFAWDGTDENTGNKATFLELVPATTGKMYVWKVNNPTDGTPPTTCYAPLITWDATTDLDFTTKPTEITGDWPIKVGDATSRVTGITTYGTPIMPWILKEDSFGAVSNGIWAPVPMSEIKSARSEDNGRAATQFGVYLYFSLLDGLEKYYDNRLDDIGPNRDQGLSLYRRGPIAKLIPYAGRLIALIDGGESGYSSVMVNITGWHEIYQGASGKRIRDGAVQVIPGATVDRLWFEEGGNIYWMPIAINPDTTSGYKYQSSGYLISSWISGGFREINKFWGALQIFAENLTANIKITAYYQTDVSFTWIALGTAFTTSPMQKVNMTTGHTAYGKRWRYKIELTTNDTSISPKVKAVTVEAVTRVPMKSTWTLTAYADDAGRDIQGEHETLTAKGLLEQLKTWANSDSTPLPLTMRSNLGMFDNKVVFIENPRIRPVNIIVNGARQTVYVAECSVIGVE